MGARLLGYLSFFATNGLSHPHEPEKLGSSANVDKKGVGHALSFN